MNKKIVMPAALALCAALLFGGAKATAYAAQKKQEASASARATALVSQENVKKDETVYVLSDATGASRQIIVSDWLENKSGAKTISDVSDLSDIENVKDDHTFQKSDNGALVWDAQGEDVYYQGNSDKELPVTVAVTYTLDGKTVAPEELAGQSGHVVIRYSYENHTSETVTVDGEKQTVCVPFAAMSGLLLDNDVFRNVEVKNGRVVNDGDKTVVVGLALPGLADSLKIDENKFELPETVEIEADVENFELGNTMTVVTSEMFGTLDTDKLSDANDLTDALSQLTDAMNQLIDGSATLSDGLCTLLEKSAELAGGVDKLANGAKTLEGGTATLDLGAMDLYNGAAQLSGGLSALISHNDELNAGSRQVFEQLLAEATKQLQANKQLADAGITVPTLTIDNYAEVLGGIIKALDPDDVAAKAEATARAAVTQQVEAERGDIEAAVRRQAAAADPSLETQVKTAVLAQVFADQGGMTIEQYDQLVAAGQIPQQVQDKISATVNAQVEAKIAELTQQQVDLAIENAMNSAKVQDQITAALEAAASGAAQISALKSQLDSYNEFYVGLRDYTAGVAAAQSGSGDLLAGVGDLKKGTTQLAGGAKELSGGLAQLQGSIPALTDGVTQLAGGAKQLHEGLVKFDEEGIQKLVDAVDGDLEGLIVRLRAVKAAAEDYKTFTAIADKTEGAVRFIYRMDEIALPETED